MIRRALVGTPAAVLARRPAAAAPSVPPSVRTLREQARVDGLSVIVVGAGMAGLAAAFELQRLGAQVTVLEADPQHIGGRCRTLRRDGLYGELGAMRIPTDHDLTRHYVREMGLTLRPFVQSNEEAFLRVRGRRVRMKEARTVHALFGLTPDEVELGDGGLWETTVTRLVEALNDEEVIDLHVAELRTSTVADIDRQSLYRLWASKGLSPAAIQLLASTWSLETSLHVSLLEHVREEYEGTWVNGMEEIADGTDTLPAALASSLKRPVRTGCPVTSVTQDATGVRATIAGPSGLETLDADWLICTAPLGVLDRIRFDPPLSPRKRDAVRRVSYDSSTKVLAVARRRFWETEDGIFGGGSVSDGALGSTWYPADNHDERDPVVSTAPAMFLASYTWGQLARRMSPDAARNQVPAELATLHDSLAADPNLIQVTTRWSWDEYPWTRGAYAFYQPGEHADRYADLVAPEGRVFLAGEHASTTHSWIQGAIQSGLRVALAIVTEARESQA